MELTSIAGCGPTCTVCPLFSFATSSCDGATCSVQCDSPDDFLDDAGCHAGATQVAVGEQHACVRIFDGTLRCWGGNFSGEMGIGVTGSFRQQPVVPAIADVLAIGAGRDFTCALRTDRSVWCWGNNTSGQLGRGAATEASPIPEPVLDIDDAQELSVGALHACVTRPSGVYCWGDNAFGQAAIDASVPSQPRPVQVNVGAASQVSAGGRSTCALLSDSGAVRCWGESSVTEFVPDAGDAVRAVAVGGVAGCVVLESNAVQCWGQNGNPLAAPVAGVGVVDSIALSQSVACVVSPDGVASCWGANDVGQLGRGTTSPSATESAPVSGLDSVQRLSVADTHVCALRTDGSVLCWGDNRNARLGTYRVTSSTLPLSVNPW